MIGPLVIRADGDRHLGTGHVMRMFALAEATPAVLVAARLDEALARRLEEVGAEIVRIEVDPGSEDDARATLAIAHARAARWIASDGYGFGDAYQRVIHEGGVRHLLVDDFGHAEHYVADLVLNTNAYAREDFYPRRAPHTRLLIGPAYTLLRREFLATERAEIPGRVLVTMGGADPVDATTWVVDALERIEVDAEVIVGPANPNRAALEARASPSIRILGPIRDMARHMAEASLAIASAGTTTYELCSLGVPTILTVLADNQVRVAGALGGQGAALDVGWHRTLDAEALAATVRALLDDAPRRATLAARARALVDGRGVERVMMAMSHD